ncbi:MAG TPA: glycosyltransferase [Candidatus Polarisedimenticolaceae bacterium]|nr:glycosyltransferase [Candidatus Polarisedimenticolaceae bacterium]
MKRTLFEADSQHAAVELRPPAERVALSVVIPVSERVDRLVETHRRLVEVLAKLDKSHEIIYVLDGPHPAVIEQLNEAKRRDTTVHLITLNRWFGEAAALAVGFERSVGETIITLPSYPQVEPAELPRMLAAYEQGDVDLLIARRDPRVDSRFNRLQSRVFHGLTRWLTGTHYRDVSCGVKLMKRSVAAEVEIYGDLHRFFPLLADQRGFKVEEIAVPQSPEDAGRRIYRPGLYLRRLLDLLTLFFIFKFTKKPLRFFGLLGSGLFGAGGAILIYLAAYRLLQFGPIANRPLLILGALLIVLGLQLFSIGLLGEIVIFTHAGGAKDYQIREVRQGGGRFPGSDRS